MCICIHIYICMYVCMYVRTYVCMYVCMYIYEYVLIYIYNHIYVNVHILYTSVYCIFSIILAESPSSKPTKQHLCIPRCRWDGRLSRGVHQGGCSVAHAVGEVGRASEALRSWTFLDPTSTRWCSGSTGNPSKNLQFLLLLELDPTHIQSVANSSLSRNRQQSPFCCWLGLARLGFLAQLKRALSDISKAVPRYNVPKKNCPNHPQPFERQPVKSKKASPPRSCLHFAYLGRPRLLGSSIMGTRVIFWAPSNLLLVWWTPNGRDKFYQSHPGSSKTHRPMSRRATTDLKRRRLGVLSPRGPRSSSVCDFWAATSATFRPAEGQRLDALGVKNLGNTPKWSKFMTLNVSFSGKIRFE